MTTASAISAAARKREPLYSEIKASPSHEHIISALVENRPGVLAHISGMFAARGFNIASLAVGPTLDPSLSRMTIVSIGDDRVIEQIIKQLRKIIDVVKVVDLRERVHLERELVLVKVKSTGESRAEVMQIADIFRARIIDVHHDSLVIELSGAPDKINAMMDLLEPFGILEIARTGRIALFRGPEALRPPE